MLAGELVAVERLKLGEVIGELCLALKGADDRLEGLSGCQRVCAGPAQLDQELGVGEARRELLHRCVGDLCFADAAQTAHPAMAAAALPLLSPDTRRLISSVRPTKSPTGARSWCRAGVRDGWLMICVPTTVPPLFS